MWHEARRCEKVTQKLLTDHKKRVEKRREDNRVDPNSLLQVNGIKSRLHLDPNIYKQAEKSLVVWQGDKNVTIDRFDVRATLTSIPTDAEAIVARKRNKVLPDERRTTILDIDESDSMKKLLNYERYRLLMQNDLNRVPEETRLRLVAKSEFLTDAKMKKLKNNKFGTSGETCYATTSQLPSTSFKTSLSSRERQSGKKGVAIGYNYDQDALGSVNSNKANDSSAQGSFHESQQNAARSIIDLDQFDNIELDDVDDLPLSNGKRANEVTIKYGLTCDEYALLAKNDSKEVQTMDIIRELKKVAESIQHQSRIILADTPTQQAIYGPSLPPEMLSNVRHPPQISASSSSAEGSPVRQRSPSGACIPLRNGRDDDLKIDKFHRREESLVLKGQQNRSPIDASPGRKPSGLSRASRLMEPNREPIEVRYNNLIDQQRSLPRAKSPSPSILTRPLDNSPARQRARNDEKSARRAETPLAYKRHCRSSRSLSRERRLNRHHGAESSQRQSRHDRRRSRHRSYSRSRSCSRGHSYSNSSQTSFSSTSKSRFLSRSPSVTYSSSYSRSPEVRRRRQHQPPAPPKGGRVKRRRRRRGGRRRGRRRRR